jgi:SAM-dependent methyltransferase
VQSAGSLRSTTIAIAISLARSTALIGPALACADVVAVAYPSNRSNLGDVGQDLDRRTACNCGLSRPRIAQLWLSLEVVMDIPPTHQSNADQAAYWNGPAVRRWIDRQETQDALLAPISDILFDQARVAAGDRVVDIGCGCGATSIELARRVGPTGHVLGVDISAPMLARARELAPPHLPLEFALADATVHGFERAQANLMFSRFGVMFFADPAVSFTNIRTALRPGGRLAFACWREPRKNPWMMLPLQEAYKHVPRLPERDPEDPGPFSFAREERVHRLLSAAGFCTINMKPFDVFLDLAVGRGLQAAVDGALQIGPVSRALEGQSGEATAAVASAIRGLLASFRKGDTVPLAGSVWITTAISG